MLSPAGKVETGVAGFNLRLKAQTKVCYSRRSDESELLQESWNIFMKRIKIVSINRSDKKGTVKKPVREAILRRNWGLVGDAHCGLSRRQVSLLGIENIKKFITRLAKLERCKSVKFKISPGDFAENITIGGFDLNSLRIGTKLRLGSRAVIEITQRGKKCHARCEIRKLIGDCIMPKEGLFAKVISGGKIKAGDPIEIKGEDL